MKKISLVLLSVMLCLSLFGCKTEQTDSVTEETVLVDKNGEISVVIDIAEEISSAVVTREDIREQMKALYDSGVRKVYFETIPEGYPARENCIDNVFIPADYDESCLNKSVSILLDPNLAYSYECRAAGMEAIAIYAPYDGGGSVSIPTDVSADTLFDQNGRHVVGGTAVYNTVFAGEHPEYLVAARSDAVQNTSEKINTIEVVFAAEAIQIGTETYDAVDEGNLAEPMLFVSTNNMSYSKATGYTFDYRVTYRNFYDANGNDLGIKKAYVLTLDLFAVSNRQYYAIEFENADGLYTLPYSMINTYDKYNRQITSTVAVYARDTYSDIDEDYHWGSERTPIFTSSEQAVNNFKNYGFEFEYGTLGENGDGWASCLVYGIAKGHNAYMRGALCEVYPEVREYWLDQIDRLYAMGYDGICIRLEGYGAMVSDYKNYGFNTLLVNRFKQECGIDMLNEEFDYLELMRFRGKYFLEFLASAADMSHKNGKSVGIELTSGFETAELSDDINGICHALMPKIFFDYKSAIDICDSVIIKDRISGEYDSSVASQIKSYTSDSGKTCYVFCHSDSNNTDAPYMDALLRDATCHGGVVEISCVSSAVENVKSIIAE